jgi:hypothetical protein
MIAVNGKYRDADVKIRVFVVDGGKTVGRCGHGTHNNARKRMTRTRTHQPFLRPGPKEARFAQVYRQECIREAKRSSCKGNLLKVCFRGRDHLREE